jgi:hypothetical protein
LFHHVGDPILNWVLGTTLVMIVFILNSFCWFLRWLHFESLNGLDILQRCFIVSKSHSLIWTWISNNSSNFLASPFCTLINKACWQFATHFPLLHNFIIFSTFPLLKNYSSNVKVIVLSFKGGIRSLSFCKQCQFTQIFQGFKCKGHTSGNISWIIAITYHDLLHYNSTSS